MYKQRDHEFKKKLGEVYGRKRKDYVIVCKSQKQNNLKRNNVAHFQYRENKVFLDYSSRGKLVTAVLLLSREIIKWLRMLVTLAEHLSSPLRTLMVAPHLSVPPLPEDLMPFSRFCGNQECMWYVTMESIHTHKIKLIFCKIPLYFIEYISIAEY